MLGIQMAFFCQLRKSITPDIISGEFAFFPWDPRNGPKGAHTVAGFAHIGPMPKPYFQLSLSGR